MRTKHMAAALMLFMPVSASAQWAPLGGGAYTYTANIAWSATFSCDNTYPFLTGSCTANGSSVLLERDGQTATVSFTGAHGPIVFSTAGGVEHALGTINIDWSGDGPFGWPEPRTGANMFRMVLSGTSVDPVPKTVSTRVGFNYISASTLHTNSDDLGSNNMFWGFGAPAPAGTSFSTAGLESLNLPAFIAGVDVNTTLTARAFIAPEPSTYALMAVGLLAIAAAARAQRA